LIDDHRVNHAGAAAAVPPESQWQPLAHVPDDEHDLPNRLAVQSLNLREFVGQMQRALPLVIAAPTDRQHSFVVVGLVLGRQRRA
jgi:hypothetical protein